MKMYRAKSGIFDLRVFYGHDEMEDICLQALVSVELLPENPAPVRIDRFIKKKFEVDAEYLDLPDGTLGFTKFGPSGVERIVVAKTLDLDGSITASRRVNTTLAHEAGHGLFHSHLFNFQPRLFEADADERKVLCRDELRQMLTGSMKYDGEWWEYQANFAIGALLLPRELVKKCVESHVSGSDSYRFYIDDKNLRDATALVAETFDVNPAVARIRLKEIFPSSDQIVL